MAGSVDRLAEHTPATRDRYVDFLRAASILAVVAGHWLISLNQRQDGEVSTVSAIGETSWLWLGTCSSRSSRCSSSSEVSRT